MKNLKEEFLEKFSVDNAVESFDFLLSRIRESEIQEHFLNELSDNILTLKSWFQSMHRDYRMGTLSQETYSTLRNRIFRDSLLQIDYFNDYKSYGTDYNVISERKVMFMKWKEAKELDSYSAYESFLNEYPHSSNASLAISRLAELKTLRTRNYNELNVWLSNQERPVYAEMVRYLLNTDMNIFNEGMEDYLLRLLRSNNQFWITSVQDEYNRRELSDVSGFISVNGHKKFSNKFLSNLQSVLLEREEKHWSIITERKNIFDFVDYYLMYHYDSIAIVKFTAGAKMLKWINYVDKIIESNQVKKYINEFNSDYKRIATILFFLNIIAYPLLGAMYAEINKTFLLEYDLSYLTYHYVFLFAVNILLIGLAISKIDKKHNEKFPSMNHPIPMIANQDGAISASNLLWISIVLVIFICSFYFNEFSFKGIVLHTIISFLFLIGSVSSIYDKTIKEGLTDFKLSPRVMSEWRFSNGRETYKFMTSANFAWATMLLASHCAQA